MASGGRGSAVTTFAIAETLEHDHRAIDEELERVKAGLKRGEWHRELFEHAADELRHHIYVEEETLFPSLRQAGMVAPVFVMIREHGEIWRALDVVRSEDGRDMDRAIAAFESMEAVLSAHNFKEEQILYPASDSTLDPEHIEAVRAAFEDSKRPEEWLPQALRG